MKKLKMEKNPFPQLPDLPVLGQTVKLLRSTKHRVSYKGLPFKIVGCSYGLTRVTLERSHRFLNTKTKKLDAPRVIRFDVPYWCITEAKKKGPK